MHLQNFHQYDAKNFEKQLDIGERHRIKCFESAEKNKDIRKLFEYYFIFTLGNFINSKKKS